VHIQFFQAEGSPNFTLRATPWGSSLSHGEVTSATTAQLLMVGGGTTSVQIKASSRVANAPPCTALSTGWCKFPYCGFPQPPWPAWSPPTPPPAPPAPPPNFPPPTWTPNWNLTESTTIQPSGNSYFMPNHTWGLVSLDWSVARSIWMKNGRNHTNNEAVSTEGCRRLKAAGKASRCFIYHNMELALEWEESQRKVMYDPATADYFLQYTDGKGNKNGTIYQEDIAFGDQYFWDYTNEDAADYFISSVVSSLDNPAVDGTFTDDVGGLPQEHAQVMRRIGMSASQLKALQDATTATHHRLVPALVKAGKYNWQAFGGGDGTGPGISEQSCTAFMKRFCDPAAQKNPMMMSAGDADNQTVAAFLITRPPIAFIGWGWESDDKKWNDIFLLQAGEPKGLCAEVAAGVFERVWTNGKASLNCNTYTADLPFPSL